jgi:hypothetical protein
MINDFTLLIRCRYWTQCKNLAHQEICRTNSLRISSKHSGQIFTFIVSSISELLLVGDICRIQDSGQVFRHIPKLGLSVDSLRTNRTSLIRLSISGSPSLRVICVIQGMNCYLLLSNFLSLLNLHSSLINFTDKPFESQRDTRDYLSSI